MRDFLMKYTKLSAIAIAFLLALASSSYKYAAASTPQQLTAVKSNPDELNFNLETYNSRVMGGQRTYGVCLPPGYAQNRDRRYPVVFLLHGGNGDATDWFNPQKGSALKTLQALYTQDKLLPSIIITPDGNDSRGKNSKYDPDYFDGSHGKVSTAIGDELVKLIASRYRTLAYPKYWAIGGLSSGAWGAVNIGLHHPESFSILFSHSGYFTDKSGAQNSPMQYIKTLLPQVRDKLHIYLDTGTSDGEYVTEAQKFHVLLNQLNVKNKFNQFPGTHSWRYWRTHLTDSLTYVGKVLGKS